MGGERNRHQEFRRRIAQPDGEHHDHGIERGDRSVRRDQGGQHRDRPHDEDQQPAPAPARVPHHHLPDPGRDARRVERLGDYEQRRDQDDGRVGEPRERLLQRDHIGRPQRQRDPERHDADRQPVPDEHDDGDRQDGQDDRLVAHLTRLPRARAPKPPPGNPGRAGCQ